MYKYIMNEAHPQNDIIMCTWLMGVDGPGVLGDTGLKLKVKSALSAKVACKCCT
jgi:hypothetical protein